MSREPSGAMRERGRAVDEGIFCTIAKRIRIPSPSRIARMWEVEEWIKRRLIFGGFLAEEKVGVAWCGGAGLRYSCFGGVRLDMDPWGEGKETIRPSISRLQRT